MSTTHPGTAALAAWTDGVAGAAVALSVEQHLVRCADCRAALARLHRARPRPELPEPAPTWERIRERVVLPEPGPGARLLVRAGLPEADAVLVMRTPALRLSWMTALGAVVTFVLLATALARHDLTTAILMAAPLVPMAGVALAYGPARGAAVEQLAATPYPALRLVLLRTVAVLVACLPLVLLADLALPGHVQRWWLLPACAFTATVLGLSSWVRPSRCALALAVGWLAAVSTSARWSTAELVLAPSLLWLYGGLLVVAPVLLVVRTRRLGTLGRISS